MSGRVATLEAEAAALLASDRVTAPTRRALAARLRPVEADGGALSARQIAVLAAVSARLVPLRELDARVELAQRLSRDLADGPGDGWRYADMPADAEAVRAGLDTLDAGDFAALAPTAQDALLHRVQAGEVEGWPVPPARWFEEVLSALVRLAYAHPLVQLDIGYHGMADAHGFQDLDAPPR